MELQTIKKTLYNSLHHQIDQRIDTAQKAMHAAESSKSSQTKSSAGDKFETGRAMMQAEEDRSKAQVVKALAIKNELSQIPLHSDSDTIGLGSLVIANQGNYFLSVGLGKVVLDGTVYYAISMESPVGKLLEGKKVGEKVSFRGRDIVVNSIC